MNQRELSDQQLAGLQGVLPAPEDLESPFWKELGRLEPEITKCRNLTMDGVGSDETAKESYCNLLRAGTSPPEMLEMLVGMAVSVPRRGKAPRWLWGFMTPKQVAYLPGRLKRLADEIERFNKHPLLRPDVWIYARRISETHPKPALDYLGKRLLGLPGLLRTYAAFIDGHSKSMNSYLREAYRSGPRSQVLAALISFVRRQTGRARYEDLANLLAAAAGVEGSGGSDLTFTASALKALDRRMRQKQERASPTEPT
jgi:hypothetical protein